MFFGRKSPHFVWDRTNQREIDAHRVTENEVEEAFEDPKGVIIGTKSGPQHPHLQRLVLIGRTESGRLLSVPYEIMEKGLRPVTAYDSGKKHRSLYWSRK